MGGFFEATHVIHDHRLTSQLFLVEALLFVVVSRIAKA